jgi:type IV pilus assembly protein PilP
MIGCRTIVVMFSLVVLGGCSGAGEEELQQWMTEQRSQTKPQIAPIPAPKKFLPQTYVQDVGAEPFSVARLMQALRQESGSATANAALVAPELSRRKEPLESMPLDSIKMVGSLNKAGQLVAIVKVDNLLYQVKPGNYLGPNYGRINKVSETEIVLREIVQDAAGEWIERAATLQLQERSR